jgi:hypothetical protein
MVVGKKSKVETMTLEVPSGSDLFFRIKEVSQQTGIDITTLLQKWVLQEESLIGLMQYGWNQATEQTKTSPVAVSEEISDVGKLEQSEEINPESPNYRKVLIKMAKKLKKEGMTLVKIAEIFNNQNLQTVTGKGKWYSSLISNLLSSKK